MKSDSPAGRVRYTKGFTLIEMAIVLIVIGLIVGGVLTGQDMIRAAQVRATITQIERFNTAANAFRGKYGGLPGDLQLSLATQFGFTTTNCTGGQGNRNGDGLLDGGASPGLYAQAIGETGLFWQDLSTSLFISDNIPGGGGPAVICGSVVGNGLGSTPGIYYVGNYFPAAKLGGANFIYVYENGGSNWFGLVGITTVDGAGTLTNPVASLTVMQAYNIDSKIDDGIPTTGNVTDNVIANANSVSANMGNNATDTSGTCAHYFVGGLYNPGYSIAVNNGAGVNCALSIRMQAGD